MFKMKMKTKTAVGLRSGGSLMAIVAVLLAAPACDDTPTRATVSNSFSAPAQPGASATVVFKTWWAGTLFSTAVAPGETSEIERTIPATDYAYALLAPGWPSDSSTPPTQLIALQSIATLSVARGDLLTIDVSEATFAGDCAAGQPLDPTAAEFIVERIFPGDFAKATYDAATCSFVRAPVDAGWDAGTEASPSP